MAAIPRGGRREARRSFGIAAAILAVCFVFVMIYAWIMLRESGISLEGMIALTLGILATLGVGIGLMSLLFFSNRGGFDDRAGGR